MKIIHTFRFYIFLLFFVFIHVTLQGQASFVSAGSNGSGSGGSFSSSFGQFACHYVYSGLAMFTQGVQFPFEESIIPDTLNITDEHYISGYDSCFDALQVISVAGDGNSVIIESGAVIDYISGNTIHFLPGFIAEPGSHAHAWITTDHTFCEGIIYHELLTDLPEKSIYQEIMPPSSDVIKRIKLYPNPSDGHFKIELINFKDKSNIYLYNIQGSLIFSTVVENSVEYNFSLPLRQGIYFIRINGNDDHFTRKLIVR